MASPRSFGERHGERAYRVRHAAYAVIFDDLERVACVSAESGLFLPGGGLEPGEDAVRAVQREVAEECGRTLEVIVPLESAIQFFRTSGGESYELHASFFLAGFGEILDRPSQHELSWLPAAPRPPEFFHECHRWAVQQGLQRARSAS